MGHPVLVDLDVDDLRRRRQLIIVAFCDVALAVDDERVRHVYWRDWYASVDEQLFSTRMKA